VLTGVHAIVFSQEADETRTFFRDTLGLESVDAGGGWLIFGVPAAELAAHPTDGPPHHELYLMCDDIHATVAELKGKGVRFTAEISEERWGLITELEVPGSGRMMLYEPRHPRPVSGLAMPQGE
jgi:catechol 2,3-dioxygenase-like lactoylglutathione lyase family enzyme